MSLQSNQILPSLNLNKKKDFNIMLSAIQQSNSKSIYDSYDLLSAEKHTNLIERSFDTNSLDFK